MNRLPTFSLTHPQTRTPEGASGEAAASPDFDQGEPAWVRFRVNRRGGAGAATTRNIGAGVKYM